MNQVLSDVVDLDESRDPFSPTLLQRCEGGPELDAHVIALWFERTLLTRHCKILICSSPDGRLSMHLTPGNAMPDAVLPAVPRAVRRTKTERALLTILVTDIVDSTRLVERIGDQAWHHLLKSYHAILRAQIRRFSGREIDTAGDGVLAVFDGPGRAVQCAQIARARVGSLGMQIRAGVHTGECQTHQGKVAGVAVHLAARIASSAQAGEVLVSNTVRELVSGSQFRFSDGEWRDLKGLDEQRQLFALCVPN